MSKLQGVGNHFHSVKGCSQFIHFNSSLRDVAMGWIEQIYRFTQKVYFLLNVKLIIKIKRNCNTYALKLELKLI